MTTSTVPPPYAHDAAPAERAGGAPAIRPATVGIVGGGQLGRMLLQAAPRSASKAACS
jgi:phosphoglycerate dehydrogenase-like enzyme